MATFKEDKDLLTEEAKLDEVENGIIEDGKGEDE